MTPWRFEWRRTWDAVWAPEFVAEWERLLSSSTHANVYHVPALVRAWAETHGKALGAEPLFGFAAGPGGVRVLATFVLITHGGRYVTRRVLTAAGDSFFGYHDPLVSGANPAEVDWSLFWHAVREEVAGRCDHALLRFVHPAFASGPLVEPSGDPSLVLVLSGLSSLDEALLRCSVNHRGDVRRRLRRIREAGDVKLSVTPGAGSIDQALHDFHERFVPAYSAHWRSRPEGCMLDRPSVADFVGRVMGEGLRSGWARYDALTIDGRSIGWHIGLTFRGQTYWWIPAHDVEWQAFSPGKVLLARLIEQAIEHRVDAVHFLTGAQRYKLDWKPEVRNLSAVRWHAPSAKGAALAWYDSGRRLVSG